MKLWFRSLGFAGYIFAGQEVEIEIVHTSDKQYLKIGKAYTSDKNKKQHKIAAYTAFTSYAMAILVFKF